MAKSPLPRTVACLVAHSVKLSILPGTPRRRKVTPESPFWGTLGLHEQIRRQGSAEGQWSGDTESEDRCLALAYYRAPGDPDTVFLG